MHEDHLYKEINKWKKIAISLTIFVSVSVIGGVSFILGRESVKPGIVSLPVDEASNKLILGSKIESTPTPDLSDDSSDSEALITPTTKPQPAPSVRTKSITLKAVNRLDGFRSSNGSGSTSSNVRAGRDNNLVTRAFLSFDITDLPDDIEVISAELRVFQTKTLGNPYKLNGDLMIDHLEYGDSLDSSDYSTPALLSNFDVFSNKPTTGWREVDVTNELINDIVSARAFSQFRLHFEKELVGNEENGDFAYFESSEDTQHSGNTPQLAIEYTNQ